MEFLDTNIILRFLTKDNPDQSKRAHDFFQKLASGTTTVTTTEGVVVETIQVLSSKAVYNLPRQMIQFHLTNVINLPGLHLAHKQTYLRALDLYVTTNIDFVDALNVAHMERLGVQTIVSFDRHFDQVAGISRREP